MDDPGLGLIMYTAFAFPPRGWASCEGQTLSIAQNQALFSLLGTRYGGDGATTFRLPNLHLAGSTAYKNLPDQGSDSALRPVIALQGVFNVPMAEPYLGQVVLMAFPFASVPTGWLPCNGQQLQISQYVALFSLLGTTYGGNGTSTFNLPDMRSANGNGEYKGFEGTAMTYYIATQGIYPARG